MTSQDSRPTDHAASYIYAAVAASAAITGRLTSNRALIGWETGRSYTLLLSCGNFAQAKYPVPRSGRVSAESCDPGSRLSGQMPEAG